MSLTVRLDDLLDYSDHERRKWRDWIAADRSRLAIPLQPGGRFPDVQAMLDHVFLVERRHLARLEGGVPPDSTGIPPGDVEAMFEYAELVRKDFRRYLADTDQAEVEQQMTLKIPALGTFTVPRLKLVTHMVLHEIRHFAQLALAARVAGHPPPGEHDLLFYPGPAART
jgi:uncharacterized damage-inducible protein DinB